MQKSGRTLVGRLVNMTRLSALANSHVLKLGFLLPWRVEHWGSIFPNTYLSKVSHPGP